MKKRLLEKVYSAACTRLKMMYTNSLQLDCLYILYYMTFIPVSAHTYITTLPIYLCMDPIHPLIKY